MTLSIATLSIVTLSKMIHIITTFSITKNRIAIKKTPSIFTRSIMTSSVILSVLYAECSVFTYLRRWSTMGRLLALLTKVILERLARDQCYSLLGRFANFKEIKVLRIQPQRWVCLKIARLSCSLRCDPTRNYQCYEFGHTLLCHLSPT
jgi:hypothetical protein